MSIWHTWFAFFGLISGLLAASVFNWPPLRTAAIGFGGGMVAAVLVNLVSPQPAPCLQDSKGIDILRAYSLKCVNELESQLQRDAPKK